MKSANFWAGAMDEIGRRGIYLPNVNCPDLGQYQKAATIDNFQQHFAIPDLGLIFALLLTVKPWQ
ncbi:MAG: hypothetical protein WA874_19740 [Chryseosolibacter sp.]